MKKNRLCLLLTTFLLVALSCGRGWAEEYGGTLQYGDKKLTKPKGGAMQATPDTPITVTASHPHGLRNLYVEIPGLAKARVARSSSKPKELTATFTLRKTFGITKPGEYVLTARGYQEQPPDGKGYLGPRPFYFVKTTVNVVAGQETVSEDEKEARRGWTPSGKGVGFGSMDWQMVRATFNSGPYDRLAVVCANNSRRPVAWFDDVAIEGIEIENPGFEELSGKNQFKGWEGRLWLPWNAKWHKLKEAAHMIASTECHGGKTGLQVIAPWKDAFLVRQRVDCKPHTDYTVGCWMRATGSGRLEVFGLKPTDSLDNVRNPHGVDPSVKPVVGALLVVLGAPAARTDIAEPVIEVREDAAAMRKRFSPGRDMPFLVTADVVIQSAPDRLFYGATMRNFKYPTPTEGEKATAVLRALDPDGAVLAETSTRVSTPIGLPMRLAGFAGASEDVIVEVTKTGPGVVRFGSVSLGPPDATVAIRSAEWRPREDAFTFPEVCPFRIDPALAEKVTPSTPEPRSAIDLLSQETGEDVTFQPAKATQAPLLAIAYDGDVKGKEEYRVEADRKGIRIAASTPRGAFYGLVTVMDLLVRDNGKWIVPGCAIEDGPDLPVRWFRSIHGFERGPEYSKIIARLKFNGATTCQGTRLIEGGLYHAESSVVSLDRLLGIIATARRYGVACIPMIQNTCHAESAELRVDPSVAEGTAVEGEKLTLKGDAPTPLAHGNVIQTESSRVVLGGADGTSYEEGRDFRVIAKPLKFPYFDNQRKPTTNPAEVARTETSRIPDGGEVLASYDYVARHPVYSRMFSRCLTDPRGFDLVEEHIKKVLTSIPPCPYVHLAHDEPMSYLHQREDGKWEWRVTCRRCLATGKGFGTLFAENVNRLLKAVKEVRPQTDVVIWSDTQNDPENNPEAMKFLGALSKEVILNPWYYGRSERELGAIEGWRDIQVFSRMDFRSMGCPGMFNIENVKGWCGAGYEARQRGWPFLGIFFYAGGGYQGKGAIGIPASGRWSWRAPKNWTPPEATSK